MKELTYPRSIKEWPEDDRPRERLLKHGPESLSDAELLAIVLRTGGRERSAVDYAKGIISTYGDFMGLGEVSVQELCRIKGVGLAKAAQIKAAIEIGKRFSATPFKAGEPFTCSRAVYDHFHEILRGKKKENFLVVLLDGKNRKLREVSISEGCLTSSIVHPREVFNPVVKDSAAAVILVHNHPSGDPTPSKEDREITKRLKEVGELLGVKVLDHIVIGSGRYVSFADEGML
ncbi:MAG: DNA repair protein RadC [Thermodesulfobacteriota bacterium]